MKVVIGNEVYDPEDERILLILTTDDKYRIANMGDGNDKFVAYNDEDYSRDEIVEWMKKHQ